MKKWKALFEHQPEKRKKVLRILIIAVLVLIVLAAAAAIGVTIYWNQMLKLINSANTPTVSLSTDMVPTATTLPTETTSPLDTWPQVVSNENITNIMLIGQSYREGEENKLSDTMILCSINREKNTLTFVSFLRDLYVPLPAYAGHGPGRNRINVCYPLGYQWTGTPEGGMEMLALCIRQNFGIPIDHSIEVNFDGFTEIIDILGGVEIDLTEAEARYLTEDVGYVGSFEPGRQTLTGIEALAYARIRKIDGDIQRTQRQRTLLEALINQCREIGLLELHKLATTILPMLTTDMTNSEITNYVWEFLPMMNKLELRSLSCPVENDRLPGSYWSKKLDIAGVPSYVLECDTSKNGKFLREYLGIEPD